MTNPIRHGFWLLNRYSLDTHVLTLTQSNQNNTVSSTLPACILDFIAGVLQISWFSDDDGAREVFSIRIFLSIHLKYSWIEFLRVVLRCSPGTEARN